MAALFRLLLVTGTRKTEAAGARWREFLDLDDPGKARWQIPAERFKSNATHLVPLSVDALALVATVPRWKHGDHLFSFSYGERPALALHQAKVRLDRLMLRYLQALTRLRGGDPAQVKLEPWVVHDLRRVVRTKLAALEVNDTVAEACLGHGRKGLQRVYDLHGYLPQCVARWWRGRQNCAASCRRRLRPTTRSCVCHAGGDDAAPTRSH